MKPIIRNSIGKFLALAAGLSLTFATPFTADSAVFAKFEGIDGESTDVEHDQWIDVISVDWSLRRPGTGATGQTRNRGSVIVEDFVLTMDYEKASPKLQEACLKNEVIPTLEIELTDLFGGSRLTYLKFELEKVFITGTKFQAGTSQTGTDPKPIEQISLTFEKITVTYTEYDDEGTEQSVVEYTWQVEQGT